MDYGMIGKIEKAKRYAEERSAELESIAQYSRDQAASRVAFIDVAWALINSAEFMYRH